LKISPYYDLCTRLLIPTRQQWKRWSLPNKLTCVGAYAGVLTIILFFFAWPRHSQKGGSVSVSGGLRAGNGAQARGGDANVTAGDGFNGASGGDVTIGPGEYRAGDAGAGGAGGDLNIKAGDAKFGLPTTTPNQALQPTAPPRH
jgi:hypothetical protein